MHSPTVFQNQMSLEVFDTQLGAQGMESICEHWHCLDLLLSQCGPSHVLVFIAINRIVLFFDHIHKKIPSGLDPIYSIFLRGNLLPVSFPPMFDMGESLEECEGDLFPVGKNDAGASSASTRGRTTQCLGIISESETLGVTANLLELIGKTEEDQMLGS
jgi:hypothetical protein